MRVTIGLLLYVAVMVLGSLLKKMAEDKARQARVPMSDDDDQVYTVTVDDVLIDPLPRDDVSRGDSVDLQIDGSELGEYTREFASRKTFADWDLDDGFVEEEPEAVAPSFVRQDFGWDQAIVFSEILREPRVKRAWPNR